MAKEQVEAASQALQNWAPAPLTDMSLRGIGQVLFCNSPVTGAGILGALTFASPWIGICAAIGSASASATARSMQLDATMLRNGLYSYNGALVGCAFGALGTPVEGATAVLSAIGAAASVPLVVALKNGLGSVPQYTLSFNIAALSAFLYMRPLDAVVAAAAPGPLSYMTAPLAGVSQIFLVNSPFAGALILGGIAYYSPRAAAYTLAGSTAGLLTGVAMGAPGAELACGLWGFNPALTSLAVSVFFVHSPTSMKLAAAGSTSTAVLFGGMKTALAGAGVPALTLPFCVAASACHLLRNDVPGLVLAKEPHSPEKNEANRYK